MWLIKYQVSALFESKLCGYDYASNNIQGSTVWCARPIQKTLKK